MSRKNAKKVPSRFQYRNKHAVNLATKRAVQEYYEVNSTELPDAKHVSKRSLKKTRVFNRQTDKSPLPIFQNRSSHNQSWSNIIFQIETNIRKEGWGH